MLIEIYDTNEEWKVITYPEVSPNMYKISNYGRILNIKRNRILRTPGQNSLGYRRLILQTGNKDCPEKMFSIHRLVAHEFIPNPQNLPVVNHIIPGYEGKGFNYYKNLEWVTDKYNIQYAVQTKQHWQYVGESHPNAIFSNEYTIFVFNSHREGLSTRDIATLTRQKYPMYDNVSDKSLMRFIQRVKNGTRRKHITDNKESSTTIKRNID